jgi:hypothetical protein
LALSQTTGNAGGTFAAAGVAPVSGGTFTLTTGNDVADNISASRGNLTSTFKFTSGDETVNASVGTLGDNDILLDNSTTDSDVLTVSGGTGTFTASNIETINLTTAAAAVLQLDNVTGAKNVNITGANTVTVDGFNAATFQPTIGINNITRIVTIETTTLGGAASTADAETLNLSVSGLSYGTTAATQSGITLNGIAVDNTTDVDGVYETVNLASTGTTTNDFALVLNADESIGTLNITGDQSIQIRAVSSAVSGVTVNGTDNTGTLTLRVDREGASGATNAANWTGVDNLLLVDSTAGTEGGVVASLKSGATVTFGSTFTGADSSLSLQGATYSALKDTINVTLDNVAATAAGVSLSVLDIQNVKTMNLISGGHASSTSTSGANLLNDLTGDFTTITISGDTSLEVDLNINDVQTASTSTARSVVVNASAMTGDAFVNFGEIANNSKVGYNITGTVNDDTVNLNNTAGTVDGGAGNDSITGGTANDAINGGAGNDLINISYGTDAVTGGEGNDTLDVNTTTQAARAQITSVDVEGVSTATVVAGDDALIAVVNGVTYRTAATGTAHDTNLIDAFLTQWADIIYGAHGVTVAAADATAADGLSFTGNANGTAFTVDVTFEDDTTMDAVTEVATQTPLTALDVNTTIADFAVGDVINTEGLTSLGSVYYEGAASALSTSATYGVIVLTSTAYASADAAAAAIDAVTDDADTTTAEAIVVFLNSTTGKAQAAYIGDFDSYTSVADAAVLFNFDNITTLTGLASTFSTDSFVI